MDTITHSLLGALTIQAIMPRTHQGSEHGKRRFVVAGGVAAAFPDIDYLSYWIDPLAFLAGWHRGPTHSLILLPLWALLLGSLFAYFRHDRTHWRTYVIVSALALVSHILADTITPWGTQILSPLSDYRAVIGTTFVIDPWFTTIVVLALGASLRWHQNPAARAGLAVLVMYIGIQGVLKYEALGLVHDYIDKQRLAGAQATALPQPLSPFNWKLVVTRGDDYYTALVNLRAMGPYSKPHSDSSHLARLAAAYRPRDTLAWIHKRRFGDLENPRAKIKQVWHHPEFENFRRFAKIPVLYRVDQRPDGTCVWFTDTRYTLPALTPPFRFGMCQDSQKAWRLYRLQRDGKRRRIKTEEESKAIQKSGGGRALSPLEEMDRMMEKMGQRFEDFLPHHWRWRRFPTSFEAMERMFDEVRPGGWRVLADRYTSL